MNPPPPLTESLWAAALAFALSLFLPVAAQADEPISAIDWLNLGTDSTDSTNEADAVSSATEESLNGVPDGDAAASAKSVSPANGSTVTAEPASDRMPYRRPELPEGFLPFLTPASIDRLVTAQPTTDIPAVRSLLRRVLLGQIRFADVELNAGPVLAARIDALTRMGDVYRAVRLAESVEPIPGPAFGAWFGAMLLGGHPEAACERLAMRRDLDNWPVARVDCLVRADASNDAMMVLAVGEALGQITPEDSRLLRARLDPGSPTPAAADWATNPLSLALQTDLGLAVGNPDRPAAILARDLDESPGAERRLHAAERLFLNGVIPFGQLRQIYVESLQAGLSSERATALLSVEKAVEADLAQRISTRLRMVFPAFAVSGREPILAELLSTLPPGRLDGYGPSGQFLRYLCLFRASPQVEACLAGGAKARNPVLAPVWESEGPDLSTLSEFERAVRDAWQSDTADPEAPDRDRAVFGRGETVLRALLILGDGTKANPDAVETALQALRETDLESEARQIAHQMMARWQWSDR